MRMRAHTHPQAHTSHFTGHWLCHLVLIETVSPKRIGFSQVLYLRKDMEKNAELTTKVNTDVRSEVFLPEPKSIRQHVQMINSSLTCGESICLLRLPKGKKVRFKL